MAAPTKGPTQNIHCISNFFFIVSVSSNKDIITLYIEKTNDSSRESNHVAYMVTPGFVVVVDDSSSKTTSRVDTGASDGDCGKVNHEHREADWKGCQYLHIHPNRSQLIST